MIRLFLDHDPAYQIPEYLAEEALRRGIGSSQNISFLLRRTSFLHLKNDSFLEIIQFPQIDKDTITSLLQRAPGVVLTSDLINNAELGMLESLLPILIQSISLEAINDGVIEAALNRYIEIRSKSPKSGLNRTIEQLLIRAPQDHRLSYKTISAAIQCGPHLMNIIFQHFSAVIVDNRFLSVALRRIDVFETFLSFVPSMHISTKAIHECLQEDK